MRDKIELLMEEAGAPAQEAELALSLAGYDMEQALKILHVRMKDVFVIKTKYLCHQPVMYGLSLLIANLSGGRTNPSFRLRFVFSGNPYLYETDLSLHWYEFEKAIYRARLSEWCHVGVSQTLEKEWEARINAESARLTALKDSFAANRQDAVGFWLQEMVASGHHWRVPPKYRYKTELLSVGEYRQSPSDVSEGNIKDFYSSGHSPVKGDLFLNLRISLNAEPTPRLFSPALAANLVCVRASELMAGDVVGVYILDSRDTSLYLAEVFGGYHEGGLMAIEAPVESVWREGNLVGIRVRFGHSVVGEGTFPSDLRVWACRRRVTAKGLWQRLFS